MSSVGEKVSAIYNAIENENYDSAIRIASKPELQNYPLPQVLLAYSLASKGGPHLQQGLDQCRLVMKMRPSDESTLNALDITMKMARKEEELGPFYEALALSYPDNSELKHKLFAMHIRQADGKKMQLLAQKLYKAHGDKKYVFWTVGSMLQQESLPLMMLTVAERMLSKVFYDAAAASAALQGATLKASVAEAVRLAAAAKAQVTNQPGAEELELYVEVLQRANKPREALDKLRELYSRPAGPAIDNGQQFQEDGSRVKMHKLRYQTLCTGLLSTLVVQAQADTSGGDKNNTAVEPAAAAEQLLGDLQALQRDILTDYPDQWAAHALLVSLVATGTTDRSGPRCSAATLAKHREYLRSLQETVGHFRGPYLAEIELLSVWAANGQDLPASWDLSEAPEGYSAGISKSASENENAGKLSTAVQAELATLLCRYLCKFQSKQCCFSDIKAQLTCLSSAWLAGIDCWARAQRETLETLLQQLAGVSLDSAGTADEKKPEVEAAAAPQAPAGGKKKKKGKGGAKAGGVEEPPSSVAGAKTSAADERRARAVVLLCSHSKMSQVSAFVAHCTAGTSITEGLLAANSTKQVQDPVWDQERCLELFEQTQPLCLGGIGGEKEVQPGDEMLLLASVRHRAVVGRSSESAGSADLSSASFVAYVRWLFVLEHGSRASPYSYALKVDSFDAWRALACGGQVQEQFDLLKVRHVQHDSLSYLLLPSLVEAGLFAEAKKQHYEVLKFHRAAVKDTSEMIAESFKHSNYTKGLEMKRFLGMCTGSLQLALTKAEFPLLHIAEPTKVQRLTLEEVQEYLHDYVTNDAQPLHDAAALAALQDNNDYSLLVRCDSTQQQEDASKGLRRRQLEARISESQLCLRMLCSGVHAEPAAAQEHMDALMVAVEARLGAIDGAASVGADSITLVEAGAEGNGPGLWDQELRCGGAIFEKALWGAIRSVATLSLSALRAVQVSRGVSPAEAEPTLTQEDCVTALQAQARKTTGLVEGCASTLAAVKELLLSSQVNPLPSATANDNTSVEQTLLHPQWLQRVSALSRTLAPWASLLLAAAQQSLPTDEEDFKAKASSSSKSSSSALSYEDAHSPLTEVSTAVKAVQLQLWPIIDGTCTSLSEAEDASLSSLSLSSEKVVPELQLRERIVRSCQPAGANVSRAVQEAVAKKLLADQRRSVQSLRGILEGHW